MLSSKVTISGLLIFVIGAGLLYRVDSVWYATAALTCFSVGGIVLLVAMWIYHLEEREHDRACKHGSGTNVIRSIAHNKPPYHKGQH